MSKLFTGTFIGTFEIQEKVETDIIVEEIVHDDTPDIIDMTKHDFDIFGTYENWVAQKIKKELFDNSLELISEYATYKNYCNNVTVIEKVKIAKTSFWGVSKKVKKEVVLANSARAELRRKDEEQRLKMAEKFKSKVEADEKARAAKKTLDGMKSMASTIRDNKIKKNRELLEKAEEAKDLILIELERKVKSAKDELLELVKPFERESLSLSDFKRSVA